VFDLTLLVEPGHALSFNGVSDGVLVPVNMDNIHGLQTNVDRKRLPSTVNAFTLETWVIPDSGGVVFEFENVMSLTVGSVSGPAPISFQANMKNAASGLTNIVTLTSAKAVEKVNQELIGWDGVLVPASISDSNHYSYSPYDAERNDETALNAGYRELLNVSVIFTGRELSILINGDVVAQRFFTDEHELVTQQSRMFLGGRGGEYKGIIEAVHWSRGVKLSGAANFAPVKSKDTLCLYRFEEPVEPISLEIAHPSLSASTSASSSVSIAATLAQTIIDTLSGQSGLTSIDFTSSPWSAGNYSVNVNTASGTNTRTIPKVPYNILIDPLGYVKTTGKPTNKAPERLRLTAVDSSAGTITVESIHLDFASNATTGRRGILMAHDAGEFVIIKGDCIVDSGNGNTYQTEGTATKFSNKQSQIVIDESDYSNHGLIFSISMCIDSSNYNKFSATTNMGAPFTFGHTGRHFLNHVKSHPFMGMLPAPVTHHVEKKIDISADKIIASFQPQFSDISGMAPPNSMVSSFDSIGPIDVSDRISASHVDMIIENGMADIDNDQRGMLAIGGRAFDTAPFLLKSSDGVINDASSITNDNKHLLPSSESRIAILELPTLLTYNYAPLVQIHYNAIDLHGQSFTTKAVSRVSSTASTSTILTLDSVKAFGADGAVIPAHEISIDGVAADDFANDNFATITHSNKRLTFNSTTSPAFQAIDTTGAIVEVKHNSPSLMVTKTVPDVATIVTGTTSILDLIHSHIQSNISLTLYAPGGVIEFKRPEQFTLKEGELNGEDSEGGGYEDKLTFVKCPANYLPNVAADPPQTTPQPIALTRSELTGVSSQFNKLIVRQSTDKLDNLSASGDVSRQVVTNSNRQSTGVLINNNGGYAASTSTAMTTDGTDATTIFAVGSEVFKIDGTNLGIVTAITSTSVRIEHGDATSGSGGIEALVVDNEELFDAPHIPGLGSNNQSTNVHEIFDIISHQSSDRIIRLTVQPSDRRRFNMLERLSTDNSSPSSFSIERLMARGRVASFRDTQDTGQVELLAYSTVSDISNATNSVKGDGAPDSHIVKEIMPGAPVVTMTLGGPGQGAINTKDTWDPSPTARLAWNTRRDCAARVTSFTATTVVVAPLNNKSTALASWGTYCFAKIGRIYFPLSKDKDSDQTRYASAEYASKTGTTFTFASGSQKGTGKFLLEDGSEADTFAEWTTSVGMAISNNVHVDDKFGEQSACNDGSTINDRLFQTLDTVQHDYQLGTQYASTRAMVEIPLFEEFFFDKPERGIFPGPDNSMKIHVDATHTAHTWSPNPVGRRADDISPSDAEVFGPFSYYVGNETHQRGTKVSRPFDATDFKVYVEDASIFPEPKGGADMATTAPFTVNGIGGSLRYRRAFLPNGEWMVYGTRDDSTADGNFLTALQTGSALEGWAMSKNFLKSLHVGAILTPASSYQDMNYVPIADNPAVLSAGYEARNSYYYDRANVMTQGGNGDYGLKQYVSAVEFRAGPRTNPHLPRVKNKKARSTVVSYGSTASGVLINNGSDYALGAATTITVDTVDPRTVFSTGQEVYQGADIVGTIVSMTATSITFETNNLVALTDDEELSGPQTLVLEDGSLFPKSAGVGTGDLETGYLYQLVWYTAANAPKYAYYSARSDNTFVLSDILSGFAPSAGDEVICNSFFSSLYKTGVLVNNGSGYATSTDTITVDSVDATTMFSVGQEVYTGGNSFIGLVKTVTATQIVFVANLAVALKDNDNLFNKKLPEIKRDAILNLAWSYPYAPGGLRDGDTVWMNMHYTNPHAVEGLFCKSRGTLDESQVLNLFNEGTGTASSRTRASTPMENFLIGNTCLETAKNFVQHVNKTMQLNYQALGFEAEDAPSVAYIDPYQSTEEYARVLLYDVAHDREFIAFQDLFMQVQSSPQATQIGKPRTNATALTSGIIDGSDADSGTGIDVAAGYPSQLDELLFTEQSDFTEASYAHQSTWNANVADAIITHTPDVVGALGNGIQPRTQDAVVDSTTAANKHSEVAGIRPSTLIENSTLFDTPDGTRAIPAFLALKGIRNENLDLSKHEEQRLQNLDHWTNMDFVRRLTIDLGEVGVKEGVTDIQAAAKEVVRRITQAGAKNGRSHARRPADQFLGESERFDLTTVGVSADSTNSDKDPTAPHQHADFATTGSTHDPAPFWDVEKSFTSHDRGTHMGYVRAHLGRVVLDTEGNKGYSIIIHSTVPGASGRNFCTWLDNSRAQVPYRPQFLIGHGGRFRNYWCQPDETLGENMHPAPMPINRFGRPFAPITTLNELLPPEEADEPYRNNLDQGQEKNNTATGITDSTREGASGRNKNTVLDESFESKSPSSTLVKGLRVGTVARARINFGGMTQAGIPGWAPDAGLWGFGTDGKDARYGAIYGNPANASTLMYGSSVYVASGTGYIPEADVDNIGDGNLYGLRFVDHRGGSHTLRMVYKEYGKPFANENTFLPSTLDDEVIIHFDDRDVGQGGFTVGKHMVGKGEVCGELNGGTLKEYKGNYWNNYPSPAAGIHVTATKSAGTGQTLTLTFSAPYDSSSNVLTHPDLLGYLGFPESGVLQLSDDAATSGDQGMTISYTSRSHYDEDGNTGASNVHYFYGCTGGRAMSSEGLVISPRINLTSVLTDEVMAAAVEYAMKMDDPNSESIEDTSFDCTEMYAPDGRKLKDWGVSPTAIRIKAHSAKRKVLPFKHLFEVSRSKDWGLLEAASNINADANHITGVAGDLAEGIRLDIGYIPENVLHITTKYRGTNANTATPVLVDSRNNVVDITEWQDNLRGVKYTSTAGDHIIPMVNSPMVKIDGISSQTLSTESDEFLFLFCIPASDHAASWGNKVVAWWGSEEWGVVRSVADSSNSHRELIYDTDEVSANFASSLSVHDLLIQNGDVSDAIDLCGIRSQGSRYASPFLYFRGGRDSPDHWVPLYFGGGFSGAVVDINDGTQNDYSDFYTHPYANGPTGSSGLQNIGEISGSVCMIDTNAILAMFPGTAYLDQHKGQNNAPFFNQDALLTYDMTAGTNAKVVQDNAASFTNIPVAYTASQTNDTVRITVPTPLVIRFAHPRARYSSTGDVTNQTTYMIFGPGQSFPHNVASFEPQTGVNIASGNGYSNVQADIDLPNSIHNGTIYYYSGTNAYLPRSAYFQSNNVKGFNYVMNWEPTKGFPNAVSAAAPYEHDQTVSDAFYYEGSTNAATPLPPPTMNFNFLFADVNGTAIGTLPKTRKSSVVWHMDGGYHPGGNFLDNHVNLNPKHPVSGKRIPTYAAPNYQPTSFRPAGLLAKAYLRAYGTISDNEDSQVSDENLVIIDATRAQNSEELGTIIAASINTFPGKDPLKAIGGTFMPSMQTSHMQNRYGWVNCGPLSNATAHGSGPVAATLVMGSSIPTTLPQYGWLKISPLSAIDSAKPEYFASYVSYTGSTFTLGTTMYTGATSTVTNPVNPNARAAASTFNSVMGGDIELAVQVWSKSGTHAFNNLPSDNRISTGHSRVHFSGLLDAVDRRRPIGTVGWHGEAYSPLSGYPIENAAVYPKGLGAWHPFLGFTPYGASEMCAGATPIIGAASEGSIPSGIASSGCVNGLSARHIVAISHESELPLIAKTDRDGILCTGDWLETKWGGTGVLVNNGSGYSTGVKVIVVDGVDARLIFSPGDKVYKMDGTLIGTVDTVGSATGITFVANLAVALSNNDELRKYGIFANAGTVQWDTDKVHNKSRYVGTATAGPNIEAQIMSDLSIPSLLANYPASGTEACWHGQLNTFTLGSCSYNNGQTITHASSTAIVVGMGVSGTGIPVGATVASITDATHFELSVSTTGGSLSSQTLTFSTNTLERANTCNYPTGDLFWDKSIMKGAMFHENVGTHGVECTGITDYNNYLTPTSSAATSGIFGFYETRSPARNFLEEHVVWKRMDGGNVTMPASNARGLGMVPWVKRKQTDGTYKTVGEKILGNVRFSFETTNAAMFPIIQAQELSHPQVAEQHPFEVRNALMIPNEEEQFNSVQVIDDTGQEHRIEGGSPLGTIILDFRHVSDREVEGLSPALAGAGINPNMKIRLPNPDEIPGNVIIRPGFDRIQSYQNETIGSGGLQHPAQPVQGVTDMFTNAAPGPRLWPTWENNGWEHLSQSSQGKTRISNSNSAFPDTSNEGWTEHTNNAPLQTAYEPHDRSLHFHVTRMGVSMTHRYDEDELSYSSYSTTEIAVTSTPTAAVWTDTSEQSGGRYFLRVYDPTTDKGVLASYTGVGTNKFTGVVYSPDFAAFVLGKSGLKVVPSYYMPAGTTRLFAARRLRDHSEHSGASPDMVPIDWKTITTTSLPAAHVNPGLGNMTNPSGFYNNIAGTASTASKMTPMPIPRMGHHHVTPTMALLPGHFAHPAYQRMYDLHTACRSATINPLEDEKTTETVLAQVPGWNPLVWFSGPTAPYAPSDIHGGAFTLLTETKVKFDGYGIAASLGAAGTTNSQGGHALVLEAAGSYTLNNHFPDPMEVGAYQIVIQPNLFAQQLSGFHKNNANATLAPSEGGSYVTELTSQQVNTVIAIEQDISTNGAYTLILAEAIMADVRGCEVIINEVMLDIEPDSGSQFTNLPPLALYNPLGVQETSPPSLTRRSLPYRPGMFISATPGMTTTVPWWGILHKDGASNAAATKFKHLEWHRPDNYYEFCRASYGCVGAQLTLAGYPTSYLDIYEPHYRTRSLNPSCVVITDNGSSTITVDDNSLFPVAPYYGEVLEYTKNGQRFTATYANRTGTLAHATLGVANTFSTVSGSAAFWSNIGTGTVLRLSGAYDNRSAGEIYTDSLKSIATRIMPQTVNGSRDTNSLHTPDAFLCMWHPNLGRPFTWYSDTADGGTRNFYDKTGVADTALDKKGYNHIPEYFETIHYHDFFYSASKGPFGLQMKWLSPPGSAALSTDGTVYTGAQIDGDGNLAHQGGTDGSVEYNFAGMWPGGSHGGGAVSRLESYGDALIGWGGKTFGMDCVAFDDNTGIRERTYSEISDADTSGVLINNTAGYNIGNTAAMTVDTVDATTKFKVGDSVYNSARVNLGTVTAVTATAVTIGGGIASAVIDNEALYTVPSVYARNNCFGYRFSVRQPYNRPRWGPYVRGWLEVANANALLGYYHGPLVQQDNKTTGWNYVGSDEATAVLADGAFSAGAVSTINVDGTDALTRFYVGDKVYTNAGVLIGTIQSLTSLSITFTSAIATTVSDNNDLKRQVDLDISALYTGILERITQVSSLLNEDQIGRQVRYSDGRRMTSSFGCPVRTLRNSSSVRRVYPGDSEGKGISEIANAHRYYLVDWWGNTRGEDVRRFPVRGFGLRPSWDPEDAYADTNVTHRPSNNNLFVGDGTDRYSGNVNTANNDTTTMSVVDWFNPASMMRVGDRGDGRGCRWPTVFNENLLMDVSETHEATGLVLSHSTNEPVYGAGLVRPSNSAVQAGEIERGISDRLDVNDAEGLLKPDVSVGENTETITADTMLAEPISRNSDRIGLDVDTIAELNDGVSREYTIMSTEAASLHTDREVGQRTTLRGAHDGASRTLTHLDMNSLDWSAQPKAGVVRISNAHANWALGGTYVMSWSKYSGTLNDKGWGASSASGSSNPYQDANHSPLLQKTNVLDSEIQFLFRPIRTLDNKHVSMFRHNSMVKTGAVQVGSNFYRATSGGKYGLFTGDAENARTGTPSAPPYAPVYTVNPSGSITVPTSQGPNIEGVDVTGYDKTDITNAVARVLMSENTLEHFRADASRRSPEDEEGDYSVQPRHSQTLHPKGSEEDASYNTGDHSGE